MGRVCNRERAVLRQTAPRTSLVRRADLRQTIWGVSSQSPVSGVWSPGPGPRKCGQQGVEPDSGVQRFWGPLRGLGIRPLVSAIRGLGKALKGPERLFRGLGEVCSFQRSRETRWATQRPFWRSCFPGCPLRGFQPSGSYPRATDNWQSRIGRREKAPTPKTRFSIRTLLRTPGPRPLYYKTPPCAFYHENVRSKAVFGP